MPSAKLSDTNALLRNLPSVDELLRSPIAQDIALVAGDGRAAGLIRDLIDKIRSEISSDSNETYSKRELFAKVEGRLAEVWRAEKVAGTRRVINATGVVIHTNLGRAPLSEGAKLAVFDEASGYCTLEYDLVTGKRGRRGHHAEKMLAELTGAESVLIVNNCAAAAFFVLTVFGSGGEAIISRGELVEIGGDFRVPDVLTQSGTLLREVGTTNRTTLADYENAISEKTRIILRVHPSNYRIVGFTATPDIADLADLAHRSNILIYEDIGSGALVDLIEAGLSDEPAVAHSISAGVDVVTFSGDKLLGGPQSGIIAGKREFVERLRKNPLYRALRIDKLAYAALEGTLRAYRRGVAPEEIPVLRMLSMSRESIAERVEKLQKRLREKLGTDSNLRFETVYGTSAVGGGAAPAVELETQLIGLFHSGLTASKLEASLRQANPPVIARIADDRVIIDLRTVAEAEESELLEILVAIGAEPPA